MYKTKTIRNKSMTFEVVNIFLPQTHSQNVTLLVSRSWLVCLLKYGTQGKAGHTHKHSLKHNTPR